jgi:hypothetical protein
MFLLFLAIATDQKTPPGPVRDTRWESLAKRRTNIYLWCFTDVFLVGRFVAAITNRTPPTEAQQATKASSSSARMFYLLQ